MIPSWFLFCLLLLSLRNEASAISIVQGICREKKRVVDFVYECIGLKTFPDLMDGCYDVPLIISSYFFLNFFVLFILELLQWDVERYLKHSAPSPTDPSTGWPKLVGLFSFVLFIFPHASFRVQSIS